MDGGYTYTPNANFNGTDTFGYTVNDAASGERAARTATINVTTVNDPPILDLNGLADGTGATAGSAESHAGALVYTELAPGALVIDPDQGTGTGRATLTVTVADAQAGDALTVQVGNGLSYSDGSYFVDGNPNSVATFSGFAPTGVAFTILFEPGVSDALIQQFVRRTAFATSADQTDTDRTINFVVADDAGATSGTAVASVTVTPVNDRPVIVVDQNLVNYTEQGSAVTIAAGLTVSDADNATLMGATVTISQNAQPGDVLATDATGTTIGTTFSNGVLTLSGTDTVAHHQQVLASVTFANATSDNPTAYGTADTRTVQFVTIAVKAVNDAPVITGTDASYTQTATESATNAPVSFTSGQLTFTDADNTSDTVAFKSFVASTGGTLTDDQKAEIAGAFTIGSDGKYAFMPGALNYLNDGQTVTATFTVTVSDGNLSETQDITYAITGQNETRMAGTDNDDALDGTQFGDTLSGGVGDDIINGLGCNYTLNGGSGDDTLSGGSGDNALNGGSGTDTGVLLSTYNSYTITQGGTAMTFVNNMTGENDTFTNVEKYRFSDGVVLTLGTNGADAFDTSAKTGPITLNTGDGNDTILVGATLTGADRIDGGAGTNDQVCLLGDYTGANALVLQTGTLANV